MTQKELDELITEALGDAELRSTDIPLIDLYVDQIINLVSDRQKEGTPRTRDRQLTKTMINNYSKDGLIAPVKGKKYSKEQILQILTVYTLKNTLSIGEIKRVLDGAYSIPGFDGESLAELYERHLDIKQMNRDYSHLVVGEMLKNNELDISDDKDYIAAICGIVSLSAFLKSIAQSMIDIRYPEPVVIEKDKKEKDKEKEKNRKKAEPDNTDIPDIEINQYSESPAKNDQDK